MGWEFKDQAIYAEIGKDTWEKSFLILPSFESSLSAAVVIVLSSLETNRNNLKIHSWEFPSWLTAEASLVVKQQESNIL